MFIIESDHAAILLFFSTGLEVLGNVKAFLEGNIDECNSLAAGARKDVQDLHVDF